LEVVSQRRAAFDRILSYIADDTAILELDIVRNFLDLVTAEQLATPSKQVRVRGWG